jgi:hypothetical protein
MGRFEIGPQKKMEGAKGGDFKGLCKIQKENKLPRDLIALSQSIQI